MVDDATKSQALANYRALQAKVDAKFAEIHARQAAKMRCGEGCHACCLPGLTVSTVEAAALGEFLQARPALVAELRALRAAAPHGTTRCAFLRASGACAVYEARPLVCRSHGAPLQLEDKSRDVCPLNFAGDDLMKVPGEDVVNLNTLNTILSLVNRQYTGDRELPRVALDVDALLNRRS